MHKIFIIVLVLFSFSEVYSKIPSGKKTLSGKITDKNTGQAIQGVAVYLPDLKTGTITNADGFYKIENLPATIVLVHVSFVGYRFVAEKVDLTVKEIKDFALEATVAELNEIVVTGLSKAGQKNRTPTPISTISSLELQQVVATNIIDAIAKQPGISQVTTGSGISKPVIRGLGYNRVVVINDGIRQEGQQWGDEHGIEIDEFAISKVEILKGPASLAYGSDAMAGVINMLSAPTLPAGKIIVNTLTNYQTNNGLCAYSTNFAGNIKGLIWNFRYSGKQSHSYQNKYDGYVFNSGYRESTFSGIAGLNKSWGYSHLHLSSYNLIIGITEGERDSVTGRFIKPIAVNDTTVGEAIVTETDFKSYVPATPLQKIHHYKAVLNNSFVTGKGSLKAVTGFQQNHRMEYADALTPDDYGLYFLLNTFNYDVRYNLPEKNNLNVSPGINGMLQLSQNKGIEFMIPEYTLLDIGVFITVKKSFDKLDISSGLRYDKRNERTKDLFLYSDQTSGNDTASLHVFKAIDAKYKGMSGSIGATYQFNEKVFTKFNLSRGFRAPNVAEISSNGVHEGTVNYIIGVPQLKPESSLQVDYAFGINSRHITAEMDLFSNTIYNYIFLKKLTGISGEDSLTHYYSTFKYTQGNARLTGGEISIDIHPHPLDWLHFENTISYILAEQKNQPDSMKYLPQIPAPKITSELKALKKKAGKYFANSYMSVAVNITLKQDKIYGAFETESETPGYILVNCGAGTDVTLKGKTLFSVFIAANNITDVAYQSHLSRLKYASRNNVTGNTGVFNMGRNISFKVLVPIVLGRK